MNKAIVVPDLAYVPQSGRRVGRSSGLMELRAKLKYLQYRHDSDGAIPQHKGIERWHDHGLGVSFGEILKNCERLSTNRVLAWTWVISPAPDLMTLVPEHHREKLVHELTQEVVEAYHNARGVDIPEYSYVMHDRIAKPSKDEQGSLHQLHTHTVLPATVPMPDGSRAPFHNHASKGHIELLRSIATEKFETALDMEIGAEWRNHREVPEHLSRFTDDIWQRGWSTDYENRDIT